MLVAGIAGVAVVLSLAHTRTVFFPPGSPVLPSVVADDVEWQTRTHITDTSVPHSSPPFHLFGLQSMLLARTTTAIEYERRLGRDARGFPLMVNQHSDASPPAMRGQTQMLTYWEEQTGKPSRQQRWYQWMSNQDAGPMVGALGLAGKTGVFSSCA